MKIDAASCRVIFRSRWLLLVFLLIPLVVVAEVLFHIRLLFLNTNYTLLANNICFGLLMLVRFFYYLSGLGRKLRYDRGEKPPRESRDLAGSAAEVRSSLTRAGYLFADDGGYGEKRDYGYLGTLLLYAALSLVLFTGTLDNLMQFSGTFQDGMGVATDLQKLEGFKNLSVGPLSASLSSLPKMQVIRQYYPTKYYPAGATEVAFRFPNGEDRQVVLKAPVPYRAGAFDVYMSRLMYEPKISITLNDKRTVFNGRVLLNQLQEDVDGFSFFGTFVDEGIDGKVFFQPENSHLRVIVHQGVDLLLDTQLVFQKDRLSKTGNLEIMCETMGVWSEFYLVHHRHLWLIFTGGGLALIGLVLRLAIRPRRVWLEETASGCRVSGKGLQAEKFDE